LSKGYEHESHEMYWIKFKNFQMNFFSITYLLKLEGGMQEASISVKIKNDHEIKYDECTRLIYVGVKNF
jgi:hypothetical protein